MKSPVPLGEFRYKVRFARREDINATTGTINIEGNIEPYVHLESTFTDIGYVYAAIKPAGQRAFFENIQTEWEFSHTIYIRWIRGVWDQKTTIFRDDILPDGSVYTEKYKVMRASNWNGRPYYLVLEVRLEEVATL